MFLLKGPQLTPPGPPNPMRILLKATNLIALLGPSGLVDKPVGKNGMPRPRLFRRASRRDEGRSDTSINDFGG